MSPSPDDAGPPVQSEDETQDLKPASAIPFYRPRGEMDCTRAFRRDPINTFMEGYTTLGPIFRCRFVGREVIAMGGVEANVLIWSRNELWDYHRTNAHFREQFDASYLNQLEGDAFKKKRRRTAEGFKPRILMSQTASMSKVFYDEVESVIDRPVELRLFCMRLIICMTGRVLMQADLPPGMDRTMAISNRDMLRAPTLGKWRHLFYWKPMRLWRRHRIFSFLGGLLDEREKGTADAKEDILSRILAAHPESEPPIARQELVYDLSQLFMAGSTTTSQLILWTLMFLHENPAWLAELREELKDWDPFNFTAMSPYPKLRATMLEVERLRPPGANALRISAQPFSFKNYLVPKGSRVLHLHSLCHYLPEIYEDPLAFRPSRFLDSSPSRNVHGIFSGGAHGCAGQALVRILSPLLVANLITRYDLEFKVPVSLLPKVDVVTTPVGKRIWARLVPLRNRPA